MSDWPKMKGGANVSNKSKLSLAVTALDGFFVDPTHYIKSQMHYMQ